MPEAVAFAVMPPAIPGLGSQGGFSLWLQDRGGAPLEEVNRQLQAFLVAARARPELAGVTSPFSANVPQVYADVDRDKALRQGVALGDVYQTMQAYLGGLYVNQFNRFGRQWRVFLQAEGDDAHGSRSDRPVLRAQQHRRHGAARRRCRRSRRPSGRSSPTASTSIARCRSTAPPRRATARARRMAALEEVARSTLSPSFSYDWADLSYQEKQAAGTTQTTFLLSLLFVFLILAALYESWSLPFSVLLTVPIAVFGAFLGLLMRGLDLDVYGADRRRHADRAGGQERDPDRRVRQVPARGRHADGARPRSKAPALRLRPILMTSFAFILGCVPLWTAQGSGAAARRILGTVVITGMLTATLIAIFLIPLLFVLFERLAIRISGKPAAHPPAEFAS